MEIKQVPITLKMYYTKPNAFKCLHEKKEDLEKRKDELKIQIDTLIENKRLDELPKVVEKFIDYYKILNKEENIRIISAYDLTIDDKKKVSEALK